MDQSRETMRIELRHLGSVTEEDECVRRRGIENESVLNELRVQEWTFACEHSQASVSDCSFQKRERRESS